MGHIGRVVDGTATPIISRRMSDKTSQRIGCATGRENCPSGFVSLGARQSLHEAIVVVFAALVQRRAAVERQPVASRPNELDGEGGSRIADCRQLAFSLHFPAALCEGGLPG
jgi:hypothetical protein